LAIAPSPWTRTASGRPARLVPRRRRGPGGPRGHRLTADHWEILELLRQFYAEYQLSPATRPLIKYTALKLGPEKGNSRT
jgi:hypothetical protein